MTYREKEPEYSEIIIVKYTENAKCDDAIERLNQNASKLKSYKVLLVKPFPQSQIDSRNEMIKTIATSETENPERVPIEKLAPSFKQLFESRDPSRPYAVLFLAKYRDVPVYPNDYKGEREKTGLEAFMEYGKRAPKYQAGVGGGLYLAAKFKKTIVSDTDEDWDNVSLAKYPTLAHFKKMVTTPTFGDRTVQRTAGLERERVFGTFLYKEFPLWES